MKPMYLLFVIMMVYGQIFSQKNLTVQSANLNLSKSNINRLIYPSTLISQANAQLLVDDLEKAGAMNVERQKTWLASNFKRFGIDSALVKQISIFSGRQYADCTICKKNCKGRCVQDPGADCVCISHSEPNLRLAQPEKLLNFIFLSTEVTDDAAAMEAIATAKFKGKHSPKLME